MGSQVAVQVGAQADFVEDFCSWTFATLLWVLRVPVPAGY